MPHRSQLQNFRGFFFPVDESDQFVGGNDVIQKSIEKSLLSKSNVQSYFSVSILLICKFYTK